MHILFVYDSWFLAGIPGLRGGTLDPSPQCSSPYQTIRYATQPGSVRAEVGVGLRTIVFVVVFIADVGSA